MANSAMIENESNLYQFMTSNEAQSTATTTDTSLISYLQKLLNMVRSINQLKGITYNICDNNKIRKERSLHHIIHHLRSRTKILKTDRIDTKIRK